MACLRLLTLGPERPLLSVPSFISCIVFATFRPADLLYLRAIECPFRAVIILRANCRWCADVRYAAAGLL